MNETYHNLAVAKAVNPATITATANGITVDTQGYKYVDFVVSIGAVSAAAVGTDFLTFTIEESDASGSGFAQITDANRILGTPLVLNDTALANTVAHFAITKTQKRYVRVVYTETGTFSGLFGVVALLSGAHHAPAN